MLTVHPPGVLPHAAPSPQAPVRLAVVCNWGDQCGIATYSRYLLDELRPLVGDLRIFAEGDEGLEYQDGLGVDYCWVRGSSPSRLLQRLHAWKPTFILIQHEFGIFPRAGEWLKLLAGIEGIPYAVTLHSVYEHRDKAVCTAAIRNIICHTEAGRSCLLKLGYTGRVTTVPHGSMDLGDVAELWNHYQVPYPLVQFGFGFSYKGLDVALDALALLRSRADRKYEEIFFTYLCSEAPHTRNINNAYYDELTAKVHTLGLEENVAIIRGYQSEQSLNHYLRVNKLAIFPYKSDPDNVVYGASGAVRLALANHVPTIASSSPMFADLEGVVPRPRDAAGLADEIDRVFSDEVHRNALLARSREYVRATTWNKVARLYLDEFRSILEASEARRRL